MTTHIKLKWDTVFNAAVNKQVDLEAAQDKWRESMINRYMSDTTGILWWKRNYTREEAMERHTQNCYYFGERYANSITRTKELQRVAIEASKAYEDNNDYVFLSKDDTVFLFKK